MKRILFLTAALSVVCLSFAQMTRLSENIVESPKFNGANGWEFNPQEKTSAICQYLQQELSNHLILDEGVVIVHFTVEKDGAVNNLIVEHSLSYETDGAVLNSLKTTSGNWTPGKVNGTPAQMERKIFVSFYDPEKGTIQEQGNAKLQTAIKKYQTAVDLEKTATISKEKLAKKVDSKVKSVIKLLEAAERYLPSEPSIIFWQACAFEKAGKEAKKAQKINEFVTLVDNALQAQIETVNIPL